MKKENNERYSSINERIKYKYRIHIHRSKGRDIKTISQTLKHLRIFEIFINFANFSCFNEKIANRYVYHLQDKNLSLSFMSSNLMVLQQFFHWLKDERGYKNKINHNHIDYLGLTRNQRRTAKAPAYKTSYSYEKIIKTIRLMPEGTITEQRNKAVISLQALCGMRISELMTVKLKSIICEEGHNLIYISPRDMEVKYGKTRRADFMALPQDIKDNVLKWRDYLLSQNFTERDPLFPKIKCSFNQHHSPKNTLTTQILKSDRIFRLIFEQAFKNAGYEYIKPHSFRHTMVRFAEKQTPEFLNAVRQSLGHSSIETSFKSYGSLSDREQSERIANLKYEFKVE